MRIVFLNDYTLNIISHEQKKKLPTIDVFSWLYCLSTFGAFRVYNGKSATGLSFIPTFIQRKHHLSSYIWKAHDDEVF